MSNITKLEKKPLSELQLHLVNPDVGIRSQGNGGGDGSYNNPYSEAEYGALVNAGYFTGGYVELDGEILWSLAPAYCIPDSGPGSSWVNILLSYSSASFDAAGSALEATPWTVRFTNSFGHIDFRCYDNGWLGNQYVNNYQPFGAGKVMRVSGIGSLLSQIGSVLGYVNIGVSFLDFLSAQSPDERWSAIIDIAAGIIAFAPYGIGPAFTILYTAGVDEQIKSLVLSCMENSY